MYKMILDEHKNGILILNQRFEVIYINKVIQNVFNKGENKRCGEFLECFYHHEEKKRCMETSRCSECNIRKNLVKVMNDELKNVFIEKMEYHALLEGKEHKVEIGVEIKKLQNDYESFVCLEIFKFKTEREVLISSRRLIDEVLDTLDDYIFYTNEKSYYVYANKSFCDYLGVKKIDIVGKTHKDMFPKKDSKKFELTDEIAFAKGNSIEEYEDKGRFYKIIKNRIEVENESLLACTMKDITFEKMEMEKAYFDNLTCVGNRRAYDKTIKELFTDKKDSYYLALLDLDYLRELNNELGHSYGDAALKKVADIIKKEKLDRVYRIGGDEFALIIKKDELKKISKINEKIKSKKVKDKFLSSSIGVVKLNFSEGILSNFNRADEAMYKAKEQGRGRVIGI